MDKFYNNILNGNFSKRPIVKLDEKIANQIAAGEVIERPSAIVKELIENSVDARASLIEVLISQGGKSLIQVKDNGWGISKEELPIAVCRHATSKLVNNEISNVNTYGFTNNNNCKEFKKYSAEYFKCIGSNIKDKTISTGQNIIKDTKD